MLKGQGQTETPEEASGQEEDRPKERQCVKDRFPHVEQRA